MGRMNFCRRVWIFLAVSVLSLPLLVACSSRAPTELSDPGRKTYLESQLTPQELFLHTEQYLSWILGYNLKVRDEGRGLMVTDWVMDDPHLRHQLTIRINQGAERASVLTAHFVVQENEGSEWKEIPSGGAPEEDFIVELEEQVRRVETERFPE